MVTTIFAALRNSPRPGGFGVPNAIVSSLIARAGGGAVVLDLYAGSGAGAIEALSRGAARAVLVEKDAGACRTIAENLRRTRLGAEARVVRRDVVTWLADPAGAAADAPFDLVLVDPPYADTAGLVRALELVGPQSAAGAASSRSTSGGTRRPRGSVCWRPSASAGSARRR